MVRRPLRWTGFAVASLAAGGLLGWLGTDRSGDPGGHVPAGSSSSALSGLSTASGRDAPGQPAPSQAPSMAAAAPTAAKPSLDVTRQAGVIHIASTNASLADAVRALAQATQTQVRGAELLASVAAPVTLRWQGKDPAAAWDALLGRFASTAVSCSSTACEVWIVGVSAPRNAAGSSVSAAMAASEAAPPPAPVAAPRQPAPAGNSDENPETN